MARNAVIARESENKLFLFTEFILEVHCIEAPDNLCLIHILSRVLKPLLKIMYSVCTNQFVRYYL